MSLAPGQSVVVVVAAAAEEEQEEDVGMGGAIRSTDPRGAPACLTTWLLRARTCIHTCFVCQLLGRLLRCDEMQYLQG
eukprot:COSAG02_NODE_8824_length_2430_cov_1.687822_5_plen_78_part_00